MFKDFGYWFEETGKTILMTVGAFVAFVLLIVFGAIPVANAVSDTTAEGYSGKGVISELDVAGSFCYAKVDLDNGTQDDFIVGPRAACSKSLEGQAVTIDRGRLRK